MNSHRQPKIDMAFHPRKPTEETTQVTKTSKEHLCVHCYEWIPKGKIMARTSSDLKFHADCFDDFYDGMYQLDRENKEVMKL